MSQAFPFRALSPLHPTEFDRQYLMDVVDAAERYGFNAIQICGPTHGDAGNLDGITTFQRFAKANDVMDSEQVAWRREVLRDVCKAAHDRGMEVYYWHHELWYPLDLPDVYPDWFHQAPQNRFTKDLRTKNQLVPHIQPDAPIWDYMDAKFDEAFEQCPELDGTIMTIQESVVPIYCLFEDEQQQVEALIDQYRRLEEAHRRVGKKWIIRTFAWREQEYRVVTEAIQRWKPSVPVEGKGVPMDWSFYYVYDPLLGKFPGMTNHVELAPSCEFHGCTSHPVGHPWFYTENLRYAAERGHTGCVLRMDRAGRTMLGSPDEGVLACIGAWLNDPDGTDVGEVYVRWLMERYNLDWDVAFQMLHEILEPCWQATIHSYHNDKIYMGDAYGNLERGMMYLAERHMCVEHDEPEPLAEKDEAVAYADKAAETLAAMKDRFSAEDAQDLTRRVRLLQLTARAQRELVAYFAARWQQMYEPSDKNAKAVSDSLDAMQAVGRQVREEFPDMEKEPGRSWQGLWKLGPLVEHAAETFRNTPLPKRTILEKKTADDLGANTTHQCQPAHQFARGETLKLTGQAGAKHVLVLFAGTEMCVCRPIEFHCGDWTGRLDVGQIGWFLAHERYRRYELEVPAECIGDDGICRLDIHLPDSEHSPYIREIRLEMESDS